ncbi:hypothetical protein GPJ56_005447 [Histomonas meleagridis]|uniref:uncharacterized protein n=1 Tax=Histomonas meleagridis TaxID=135588 RepID=UPI0035594C58|nr:hypothetical protein GPJ56_005447 [Histomonas meleagridis]KAH0802471.1 hypothetical protein GO595_004520 [Histomonas meleagridis]
MESLPADPDLIESFSLELIIPEDPEHCFEDVDNCPQRRWAVPGEDLFLFIKTSPSAFHINCLSFNVRIVGTHLSSRRSTFGHMSTSLMTNLDQIKTIVNHSFPPMTPFRTDSDCIIYPLKILIPPTMRTQFKIEAYIPGRAKSIQSHTLQIFSPFNVFFRSEPTTGSLILQFNIECDLRMNLPVELESTDVEIEAENPQILHDFQSNIKITNPSNIKCTVKNEMSLSSIFIFVPLTSIGASMLPHLITNFSINWNVKSLSFKSVWTTDIEKETFGISILIPPITAKVNQTTTVPFRLTNANDVAKSIDLVFEGGYIQPVAKRVHVPNIEPNSSTTIDISLLPLAVGYHPLKFWAENAQKRIEPMFPTYVFVKE